MVLAIALNKGEHVSTASLNGAPIAALHETKGYAYFYLPPFEREKYELKNTVGKSTINRMVLNDGAYSIYHIKHLKNRMQIELKMYGE